MNPLVRPALLKLALAAVLFAAISMAMEVIVSTFTGDGLAVASLVSSGIALVLVIVLLVVVVQAYRSVSACVAQAGERLGDRLEGSGKVLIAFTLWFLAGLPMGLVTAARLALNGAEGDDFKMVLVQLGITVVLTVFSWLRFHNHLARR